MEYAATDSSLEDQHPQVIEARPRAGVPMALAGFSVLALTASTGAGSVSVVLLAAPVVLTIALLPLLLTAPALLVGHQFFGFHASPRSVVACLSIGAGEAGRLALGLGPVVLFLSLGSMPWGVVLGVSLCWAILRGMRATVGALRQSEEVADASGSVSGILTLALAWWLLAALLSLRLAVLLVPYLCA